MSKYYTPELEEFHVGFEYQAKVVDYFRGIEDVHEQGLKKKDVEDTDKREDCDGARYKRYRWCDWEVYEDSFYIPDAGVKWLRVKALDHKDIEDYLNKVEQATGKKWKRGRHSVKGDAPKTSPWVEYIFEDASSMIFNEHLKKVLVEKTGTHGRGSHMVFNGTIKNKSELKRILKQIGI